MTTATLFFAFAVQSVLVGLLAWLALVGSRGLLLRTGAVLGAAAAVFAAALGGAAVLGHSKPIRLELQPQRLAEAEILAAHLVEGRAIHLWLLPAGSDAPRAFAFPWDRRRAERVLEGLRAARAGGGRAELALAPVDGDPAEPGEFVVHVAPPPPLPRKTVPNG